MPSLEDGFVPGFLEVISGPMRSGKSTRFMYIVNRLKYDFDTEARLFKPNMDTRNLGIVTANGVVMDAIPIQADNPHTLLSYSNNYRVIGIDEAQFFNADGLVSTVFHLLKEGKAVIISGLDTNFKREAFGAMPHLIAVAHHPTKLVTGCAVPGCGNYALFTQKLEGKGDPSKTIEVGDSDIYEPRCINCHYIPQ